MKISVIALFKLCPYHSHILRNLRVHTNIRNLFIKMTQDPKEIYAVEKTHYIVMENRNIILLKSILTLFS